MCSEMFGCRDAVVSGCMPQEIGAWGDEMEGVPGGEYVVPLPAAVEEVAGEEMLRDVLAEAPLLAVRELGGVCESETGGGWASAVGHGFLSGFDEPASAPSAAALAAGDAEEIDADKFKFSSFLSFGPEDSDAEVDMPPVAKSPPQVKRQHSNNSSSKRMPSSRQGGAKVRGGAVTKRKTPRVLADQEAPRPIPKKTRKKAKFENPVASRFCHVCSRTPPKHVRHAVCMNISDGVCRKVICERCFADNKFGNFDLAYDLKDWLCPHCSGTCPPRAQCKTYSRVNDKLRLSRLKHRKQPRKPPATGRNRTAVPQGGRTRLGETGQDFEPEATPSPELIWAAAQPPLVTVTAAAEAELDAAYFPPLLDPLIGEVANPATSGWW